MLSGQRLSDEKKAKIYELLAAGRSKASIAREIGVTWSTVRKYQKEENGEGEGTARDDSEKTNHKGNGASPHPRQQPGKFAATLEEAASVLIAPNQFTTSSTLIWQAKLVTEKEWGWPEMPLGDWLDTYLWFTMKQRGVILGGYIVEAKPGKEQDNGSA